jgi:hypothetical protein
LFYETNCTNPGGNMPDTNRRLKRPTSIPGSVIAGLLLVPLTAVAAVAIVTTTSQPPSVMASDETTTSTTLVASTTTSTIDAFADRAETLRAACEEGATKLLDKEREGSLSDVQTAALDALREVCAANDMAIAGPDAPASVVRVVTSPAPAVTTTTMDDSNSQSWSDDDSDDEYEHEDHESEDEHEYEDEHHDDHDEDHDSGDDH